MVTKPNIFLEIHGYFYLISNTAVVTTLTNNDKI